MRRFAVMLVAVLLAQGCSSIPLSTVMRAAQYDREDLLNMAPQDLRLEIQMTRGLEVNINNTYLKIDIEFPKGDRAFTFLLTEISTMDYVEKAGFVGQDKLKTSQVLWLSEAGRVSLNAMQSLLKQHQDVSFRYDVNVSLYHRDPKVLEGEFSALLSLNLSDKPLMLIEDFQVKSGEHREF